MKCSICKEAIDTIFLEKIAGTYIKNSEGKRLPICDACQKKFANDKEKMLAEVEK